MAKAKFRKGQAVMYDDSIPALITVISQALNGDWSYDTDSRYSVTEDELRKLTKKEATGK